MKKRFISIMMAITVIFSSAGSNNFMIYADDFSTEEDLSLDDESDITVDTEEPENLQTEEVDISEEQSDDENDPDIMIEDDSEEEESGEDLEFSDSDELFTDSDEPEVFSAGIQNNSSTPEYDVWLSDTIVSGLKMNGTTYGNSMYEILKEMQEPIYEELGRLVLGDVPLMSISSVWNNVIKREFYTNQKLIYETLLVEYIKYENKTNAEQFDTTQIDRTNAYLIKIFNELADGGPQDWASEQFMNMSVDEAIKTFENVQCMKDTIRRTKDISKNVKEFITLNANLLALEDAKQEKAQLIKNARDACASMENPNYDFIIACNEIIEEIEKIDIDLHSYVLTQSANTAMKAVIDKVWSDLCEKNIVLKNIDWSADAMDILFNTSDAASNNLKLSILYTMDCYFKMGLRNAATSYLSHPTDKEAAQTFNSCFDGYVNFQIYGNHTAKSWINSVTDDGALNHAFTYIFYRENLKNAEELKNLCDSQNKTRNQILNIINKYPDIYSNMYMKDEYKQALSVPVTPTPELPISSDDFKISEGISSPNPIQISGKCGDSVGWKFFQDGTLLVYGTGPMRIYYGIPWESLQGEIKRIDVTEGITGIADRIFEFCYSVTEVSIAESVEYIGRAAFQSCWNLQSVEIKNTKTAIWSSAFYNCRSLENITIPEDTTGISERTFYGCSSLKSIKIPDSVTGIGNEAFYGCSLEDITLPENLTTLGNGAFSGCNMKKLQLPSGLEYIQSNCFAYCLQLEEIVIPNTVKGIWQEAFYGCSRLKNITMSEKLESIHVKAFYGCKSLESITIPDSVTNIDPWVFGKCSNLKDIRISEKNEKYSFNEGGLYNKDQTVLYEYISGTVCNIPAQTKRIGTIENTEFSVAAFSYVDELEEINIDEGNSVFSSVDGIIYNKNKTRLVYCPIGIKQVKFASDVKEIGYEAFNSCKNIIELTIPEGVTTIESSVFGNCWNLKKLILPQSLLEIKEGALGWSSERINPVLYVYKESKAEEFAKAYKFQYKYIEDETHTHVWDDGEIIKVATCDNAGEIAYTCTTCGEIKKEIIEALGHTPGEWVVAKEATVLEEGRREQKCTVCGTVLNTEIIEKLKDCEYETTTIPATCTKEGKIINTCKIHGESTTEVIPKKAHTAGKWTTVKAATVMAEGSSVQKCTVCGTVLNSKTIAKLPATLNLNVTAKKTIPMQVKQSFSAKAAGLATADGVKSWTSSNKKVATVSSSGKIVAKKVGTATITVTLNSGYTTWFKVKVQKNTVTTTSLKVLNKATGKAVAKKVTLKRKEKLSLSAVTAPVTSKQKVTYTSSKKSVATVNSKGVVTAKKKGKVTITVKSGKKTMKIQVTVK